MKGCNLLQRLILLVSTLFASLAVAQQAPRFIVELTQEPALAQALVQDRPAPPRLRGVDMDLARATVLAQQLALAERIASRAGARIVATVDTVANALIVEGPLEAAAEIASLGGVRAVYPVEEYQLVLDRAVGIQRVTDAWRLLGGREKAGQGIKIGIIDTGIDSTHPAFQISGDLVPQGYPRVNREADLELANSKVIVVRNYDPNATNTAQDRKGHGTAVAMVAAGAPVQSPYGEISGLAPQAWLGSYKVFPDAQSGAPTDLILRAIDDAVKDSMDVLNLSLGGFPARRPSDDILVRAVEQAVSAGVAVVVAAGNDGPQGNSIGSPGTAPGAITVGSSYSDRVFSGYALIGGQRFPAVAGSNSQGRASIAGPLKDVAQIDGDGKACRDLGEGRLAGAIALIQRGDCTFETKLLKAGAAGAIAALIYSQAQSPEAVTMAAGSASLPGAMVSWADGLEIKNRLAVDSTLSATLVFAQSPVLFSDLRISASSSRGPNADFSIKPDLLAVGTEVVTAAASRSGVSQFSIASGTSLAAPMVAGAYAVLKAARPGLSLDQYRSLLINSATSFVQRDGSTLGVMIAGSGLLNLEAALRNTTTAYPAALSFGPSDGSFKENRTLAISNLAAAPAVCSLIVNPLSPGPVPVPSSYSLLLQPGERQEISLGLQASSVPPGAYQGFISIRCSATDIETRVPYWFAVRSTTAKAIQLFNPPESAATRAQRTFRFRVLDASGLPILTAPQVTSAEGGGRVVDVISLDSNYPGVWSAVVQLGAEPGPNKFVIEAGGLRQEVTIQAN